MRKIVFIIRSRVEFIYRIKRNDLLKFYCLIEKDKKLHNIDTNNPAIDFCRWFRHFIGY